jgi:pyrroline-5-carboxylate reductase
MQIKAGFIGGGNMAASLIGGLIPKTVPANNIIVAEPREERRRELVEQFGVQVTADNSIACQNSDVVVLAVKPQLMSEVVQQLEGYQEQTLFISIAAGVSIDSLQAWLGSHNRVVRVMPNTPALVGFGASALYASASVSENQKEIAGSMLNAVGISAWVNRESDLDIVTALSGSGPAYFMLFIKALVDKAIEAGLNDTVAKELAVQTAIGAATLAKLSDDDLTTLIQKVTSPGGTTAKAMEVLNNRDVPAIIAEAFDAAQKRSEAMALEFSH